MSFGQAIATCFAKYFQFSGRARRPEYWYFLLFLILVQLAMSILLAIVAGASIDPAAVEAGREPTLEDLGPGFLAVAFAFIAFALAIFIPTYAVTWRRLHDVGRSGWWIFAPLLGYLIMPLSALFANDLSIAFIIVGIGFLVMLGLAITVFIFLVSSSEKGENRFGPEPPIGG